MIAQLRSRHSIRKFKDIKIDSQIIEIFKEALLLSPSSRGINPWEFIFITNKEQLQLLSNAKEHGSGFLKNAAMAIIICGDEKKSDVWIEDCSIASTIVQLTAHSIGLGSCWVQIRNRMHNSQISSEMYIQNIFKIPQHIRVESVIAIGYSDETERISKTVLNPENLKKIHTDQFNA